MLQYKGFHHGGCMHEYSVKLYDNFVVKKKQSFAQPTQIFVFHFSSELRNDSNYILERVV